MEYNLLRAVMIIKWCTVSTDEREKKLLDITYIRYAQYIII